MTSGRFFLVAVALVALTQTGCLMLAATAVGGGVAGVAYVRGRQTAIVEGTLQETTTAALAALQDISMPSDKQNVGRTSGTIDSWTPDGHPLMIDLEAVATTTANDPPQTKVGIRFGPFGDKAQSERLIAQIEYRLANPAPPQPAAPPQPILKQSDEPPIAK